MTDPEIKVLVLAYLAANGGSVGNGRGVTASALATYLGLTPGEVTQRLHDYEKSNNVVQFGREIKTGHEEPEAVWRLK